MKKIIAGLFIIGFAVIAVGNVEAASYTFSSDLKMGASGADVSALQTALIEAGFSIPSIQSGRVSKGYFGRETLAAVRQYQASRQIPTTGFVGPLTRGALNGSVAVTPVQATPVLTQITTPGVAGTLSLTLHATPANGTSMSKGVTGDVATYKIQSANSDMKLSSISLDINNRLWLYAGAISILDGATVIGEIKGLNASHFTELTVGSNYRLTIPVSVIIPKSSTKYFTVRLSMLPVSDRSSATIGITRIETRAVDGTGTSDTQTLSSTRSFSYTGVNNGQVVITVNPQSPPNMVVPISSAGPTDNVPIGVADFKSEYKDSKMRSLTLYINANFNLSSTAITTLVGDIKVQSGNLVYSADTIGGTSDFIPGLGVPVTFTNMAIPLPKDTLVPIAILLKINQNTDDALNGMAASTTIVASGTEGGTSNNPVIEDASHTTVAINGAPLLTSDLTFHASNSNVDYTAPVFATLGSPVTSNGSIVAYPVSFGFSITAGDDTLYVSANPSQALATSSTGLPNSTSARILMGATTVTPATYSGDSAVSSVDGYYVIPPGSTRSFVYNGSISNTGGTTGLKTFGIDGIKYGTSPSNLISNTVVYYNYGVLKVTPVF